MEILSLLDAKGINYEHTTEGVVIICPKQSRHSDGRDSTASFRINLEKEVGYCFSCGHALSQAGMHRWLLGDDLDELQMTAMEIQGRLRRMDEDVLPVVEESVGFFYPQGIPWDEDGYRGVSLETYRKLGAIRVTRGRYANRICFPVIVNGELIGVDARYLGDAKADKVAKWLRNKDSSCKHNWLGFYDVIKEMKPELLLLGEGGYHSINGIDKGFPATCFYGVKNFSMNKVMMLLALGAKEICYVPDADVAGYQAMFRVCAALAPWFEVSCGNMMKYEESKRDLGDLTKEEIQELVDGRYKPKLPECLIANWEAKIVKGEKCKRIKCFFNSYGKCANEIFGE